MNVRRPGTCGPGLHRSVGWVERGDVQTAINKAVVLPARAIRPARTHVADDLIDVAVGIADTSGRKDIALPGDDVLAAVLYQLAGAFVAERPGDTLGDFERLVLVMRVDMAVNALHDLIVIAGAR